MINESILIKKAKSGDEIAFEHLVNTYKNYVFAIILNFIKDKEEAENIAQEVFLQVYLSLPKFEDNNLKSWIGKIASNKSIDYLRKKKSKFKEELLSEDENIEEKIINDMETPETLLIKKESKQELDRLCEMIPESYKDAIIKFYIEDKSYEDIAKLGDVSVKTIASRIYRGKLLLKEKWREKNETL